MYVTYAIISCLIIDGLTLVPFMRSIFDIPSNFGLKELVICLLFAVISTIIMELAKLKYKFNK